ncbi:MAG TPA: NADH-quinone oxidoreductase subunit N [Candidatus Deferrimicrobium sp.]|nr:NADH-quinone oxidoreductase subunit N [Candidatus Deferrimicrobium sp.]
MIDFSSAAISFDLISPEIALLVAAFVILLIGHLRSLARVVAPVALIGLMTALGLASAQWDRPASGFSGMVTCDNFSVAFKMIFIVASMLTVGIAHRFFKVKGIARPEFYALLLISTMGMMVMASSADLVVLFLGLEIMSVPLYVMAAFARRSLESNEAGIKYFILGAFASAFLLMGIAFLFGASGTTDLRRIGANMHFAVSRFPLYTYVGAALTLIGFAFKIAAVPFHNWVPDVYQGAPTPVTAYFSVAPKAAGFAALLRLATIGLVDVPAIPVVFWVLAVLTMSVGNILALRQDNVKRMLAYSSIAHAGYVLVALAAGGDDAVAAAVLYLVAYTLFNLGAFAVVTLLETRSGRRSDMSELAGLSRSRPYLAAVLALFMFSLAGFPPTVGFLGKFYIFSAAVKGGFIGLAVIGVMNSFLSVYYYLRVVKASYLDRTDQPFARVSYSPGMVLVLLITAAGTLGLGILPQRLLELSQAAVQAFL